MATLSLAGGTLTLTYATESWETSPEASYSAWAAALGVSDTDTLAGPLADDDNAWPIELAAPFFDGGATTAMFSSEAGLGLYRSAPGNTGAAAYAITGVTRMFGLVSRPTLLLTFHPSGADLQSFGFKLQRSGSTTIIYSAYSDYGDTGAYRYQTAIKITPAGLEMVGHSTDVAADWRLLELIESNGHSVISNTVAVTLDAGSTARLVASVEAMRIDGLLSEAGPLRPPVLLGALRIDALAQVAPPLGWVDGISGEGGAQLQAVLRADGLLSALAPLGALSSVGALDAVGVLLVSSPLPEARLRAHHDFSTELAPAPSRYVMDVVVNGVALRVPISTWQATQQIERACYVQCSIPACLPWVEAIQSASEFVISRVGRALDGSTVVVEMARAPIESFAFDQGPRNYTATISGYAAGLTAPDGVPGSGETRALAGVRFVSFGSGGIRARAAIDWLLKPGDYASAAGRVFVADYINYYVPATGDAYMDAGERG